MKNAIITEFVNFRTLETTTEEQLFSKVDFLNDFQRNQDGFIDAELVKQVETNDWCLIYHYENMEKVKAIGAQMRIHKVFDEFMPLTVPDSVRVTFYVQLKK